MSALTGQAFFKKKKLIVVAAARGREVFITDPRVARGIILLERCYPFGETQTSSKTRGGYHSDLSLVCPRDTRADSISKAEFSMDGSCSTK